LRSFCPRRGRGELRPFPTRRSSDLARAWVAGRATVPATAAPRVVRALRRVVRAMLCLPGFRGGPTQRVWAHGTSGSRGVRGVGRTVAVRSPIPRALEGGSPRRPHIGGTRGPAPVGERAGPLPSGSGPGVCRGEGAGQGAGRSA